MRVSPNPAMFLGGGEALTEIESALEGLAYLEIFIHLRVARELVFFGFLFDG